jgi:hypothetical protein
MKLDEAIRKSSAGPSSELPEFGVIPQRQQKIRMVNKAATGWLRGRGARASVAAEVARCFAPSTTSGA